MWQKTAGATRKRQEKTVTSTPPLTQSIGQAEKALRAVLDRLLAETGTTFVQWVTLNMLARSGSAVQHQQLVRQVEAALKLDEPTVLATLGELSALGLITPPGEAARIELTTAGDAQFQRLRQRIDSVTERLYGDLPADELTTTRRVLGIVAERANAELGQQSSRPNTRVRPSDPGWPSEASWDRLKREVGGRLITPQSPLSACRDAPGSALGSEVLRRLQNPYYIGEQPGLTQTLGWVGAWASQPSAYAVVARTTEDAVAAVNFAGENNLRLVVKGGGHSYQGTSNAADSLLVWTREMNAVTVHEAFVASGCEHMQAPQPAVTIEAGAQWLAAYEAVTTRAGRYVQGGGCATVGVAGLILSGGFGSFSKTTVWRRQRCWKPRSSRPTAPC